jgi:hypothetical protein
VGLTILCGIFPTYRPNVRMFRRIVSVPQNIVMDLKNVMLLPNISTFTRKEGKTKGRRSNTKKHSQNCPFWTYIKKKKKSTRPLFGAWSLLLVHVRFYAWSGAQKTSRIRCFFTTGARKCDHGKMPSDMRQLYHPRCY